MTESQFLAGLPDSFVIWSETCDSQAEYDLAVSVGSHGSAAACKERSVLTFKSETQICNRDKTQK